MATKSKTTEAAAAASEALHAFADMNGVNSPALETFQHGIERAVSTNKENIDAFVESMTAATKGFEVLSGESLAFAKHVFEDGVKASKAMMAVKSPQEFFTLQGEYTRSVVDQFVNQATKVNDLTLSALKTAYAPINDRVTTMAKAAQKARAF